MGCTMFLSSGPSGSLWCEPRSRKGLGRFFSRINSQLLFALWVWHSSSPNLFFWLQLGCMRHVGRAGVGLLFHSFQVSHPCFLRQLPNHQSGFRSHHTRLWALRRTVKTSRIRRHLRRGGGACGGSSQWTSGQRRSCWPLDPRAMGRARNSLSPRPDLWLIRGSWAEGIAPSPLVETCHRKLYRWMFGKLPEVPVAGLSERPHSFQPSFFSNTGRFPGFPEVFWKDSDPWVKNGNGRYH